MEVLADEEDQFYQHVRYFQRKTRCSNVICKEFVKIFRKFSPHLVRSSISRFDKKAKTGAGCDFIILHGCPKCNRHVYKPTDRERTCPFIKGDGTVCSHPRFNDKGKALEVLVPVFFCFVGVFCHTIIYYVVRAGVFLFSHTE